MADVDSGLFDGCIDAPRFRAWGGYEKERNALPTPTTETHPLSEKSCPLIKFRIKKTSACKCLVCGGLEYSDLILEVRWNKFGGACFMGWRMGSGGCEKNLR